VTTEPPIRQERPGLGAFVVVEGVYLVVAFGLAALVRGDGPTPIDLVIAAVAGPTVLAALLAVAITVVRGRGPRADLAWQWSWRAVGLGLVCGVAGLLATIPASLIWLAVVGQNATSAAGEVFGGLRAGWFWAVAVFVLVVLVAPLCEEIIFRGLLWGAVEQRWGRWVALGVTTVVFAIAHLEWTRAPLLLVIALPIGLARLWGDTLASSVVAHQVTNLLPGIVLMLGVAGVPVA
jgi:uncharacterized protein